MTYTAVHTQALATRTAGDVRGRVEVGLLKKAATRLAVIANAEDQRERRVCQTILDGTPPAQWSLAVLVVLDLNSQLANPSDAQVDAAVDTAWTYITASRS